MFKKNMFNAVSLASGSFGNSLLVFTNKTKILVDAGISLLDIRRKMDKLKISPDMLDGIFITHEHNDHSRGALNLSSTFGLPVYCNKMTFLRIKDDKIKNVNFKKMDTGTSVQVGDLTINSFKILHDSIEPVGYSVNHRNYKIAYMVDTSRLTRENEKEIENADLLVIDSNYDHMSLIKGKYPYQVKQRIMGTGHLSNEIVGNIMLNHPNHKDTEFWLAHLSENNNLPQIVHTTINHILKRGNCSSKVKYKILPRKELGPIWTAGVVEQMLLF